MYGDQPKKITNKADILQLCRKYQRGEGKAHFLYAMHVKNADTNLIIEGPAILGIVTTDQDIFFDLTNADSGYKESIGRVNFFDVQYVQEVDI
jgi:hypothetical protein